MDFICEAGGENPQPLKGRKRFNNLTNPGRETYRKGMDIKRDRIRQQRRTVSIVPGIVAIILILVSFFIKNDESQNLVRTIGFTLMLANILFRVFNGYIGYKTTREEFEERQFGKERQ